MFAPPNIVHKDGAYFVFRYDLERLSPEDRKLVFVPASVIEQMQAQHRLHLQQQQERQQEQHQHHQQQQYNVDLSETAFLDQVFPMPLDDFLPADFDLLDLSLLQDFGEPLLSSSSSSAAASSDESGEEHDEAIAVEDTDMRATSPLPDPPSQQSSGISVESSAAEPTASPRPCSPQPATAMTVQSFEQPKGEESHTPAALFAVGDKLQAADFRGYWFTSRVVSVDLPGRRFRVCSFGFLLSRCLCLTLLFFSRFVGSLRWLAKAV
jgi:hypothetical protein